MRSVHAISISFDNITKISHLASHERASFRARQFNRTGPKSLKNNLYTNQLILLHVRLLVQVGCWAT